MGLFVGNAQGTRLGCAARKQHTGRSPTSSAYGSSFRKRDDDDNHGHRHNHSSRCAHAMFELQLPEAVGNVANDVLVWVGFGTIVGLLAKAVMPGRDPGGAVATLMMGIGGTIIGCGTLSYFWDGPRVTPISLEGLVVAVGGTFILLFFYRLLGGYFFVEGEHVTRSHRRRRYSGRRRYNIAAYED